MELDVKVLTTTYWPKQTDPPCQLHAHMTRALEVFQEYYDKRTSNRKLQ